MKRWMGWTVAAAVALAMTATTGLACDEHAQAAGAKDAKPAAASGEAKGCTMPCCAKKSADETKHDAAAALPVAAADSGKACDKPCDAGKTADGKSCPKKAALAKADPSKDAPKAEPTAGTGASR